MQRGLTRAFILFGKAKVPFISSHVLQEPMIVRKDNNCFAYLAVGSDCNNAKVDLFYRHDEINSAEDLLEAVSGIKPLIDDFAKIVITLANQHHVPANPEFIAELRNAINMRFAFYGDTDDGLGITRHLVDKFNRLLTAKEQQFLRESEIYSIRNHQ